MCERTDRDDGEKQQQCRHHTAITISPVHRRTDVYHNHIFASIAHGDSNGV